MFFCFFDTLFKIAEKLEIMEKPTVEEITGNAKRIKVGETTRMTEMAKMIIGLSAEPTACLFVFLPAYFHICFPFWMSLY